jgi:hypothetical protein
MTKLKVTFYRAQLLPFGRTGWARTCVALAGGKGARAIVGEYLTDGEQLLEPGTLIVEVYPDVTTRYQLEFARLWRVMPYSETIGELVQATSRLYNWRTEHVSLREKLAELLAADRDGADIGDGTEHEREYLTECERLRHYLARAFHALQEVDGYAADLPAQHADELGSAIGGALIAIETAYPNLLEGLAIAARDRAK